MYYCNQPIQRTPGALSPPYNEHYRSDYRPHPSIWGTVFVDMLEESISTYVGPEPLSRFYLSFNAGLRAVNQIRSPGDKALLYVFTGKAVGTEPVGTPPYGLTESLNHLIQLTNIYNRGTIDSAGAVVHPRITPNFISRGFFPILVPDTDSIGSNSNHAQALWDAIGALSNCPDSARRAIIIATDGVPSCAWNRAGSVAGTPRPDPLTDCAIPPGGDYYSNYLDAEREILTTIKDELVRRGISVTTLLDAPAVDPHFINATVVPSGSTPAGIFINPEDAATNGFCGGVPGDASCTKPFFNPEPHIPVQPEAFYQSWANAMPPPSGTISPDHFAFLAKDGPQYEVKFRRPNALWGQLALDTGGVICPMQDNCNPAWYAVATPPALVPTYRQGMATMNCAPVQQSKSQQAINCVLAAIGVNPFQNVEEIPSTPVAPTVVPPTSTPAPPPAVE